MNIVLIGYRGTGKTTVARQLALRLGWEWADADVELEMHAGKTIVEIFAQDGEPAFRELESKMLADLVAKDRIVIAAGGGMIVRMINRDLLQRAGQVIWLKADVQTIIARMAADPTSEIRRPRLTDLDDAQEVTALLDERTPLYRACADLEVDTVDRSPTEIVAEILQRLESVPQRSEDA